MLVGENIRKFRKEKGLTQKKLGELSGINEVQIRQYEIGKSKPKIETLEKIAKVLDVKVFTLLDGCFGEYSIDYHKTTEYKEIERNSLGFYTVIKLLECIYKRAEDVNVGAYKDGSLQYSSNYISIGEGDNKIAIPNGAFGKIVESMKSHLITLIELSGENETDFLENWKQEPDIDSLELSISEHIKILLEENTNTPIPYLKPF